MCIRDRYGVTVKIRRATDKAEKVRWELYSDHMGEFAQRVPAGEADYILWADLKGVKSADGKPLRLVQQVTVHIYNDERADTGLPVSYTHLDVYKRQTSGRLLLGGHSYGGRQSSMLCACLLYTSRCV